MKILTPVTNIYLVRKKNLQSAAKSCSWTESWQPLTHWIRIHCILWIQQLAHISPARTKSIFLALTLLRSIKSLKDFLHFIAQMCTYTSDPWQWHLGKFHTMWKLQKDLRGTTNSKIPTAANLWNNFYGLLYPVSQWITHQIIWNNLSMTR